MIYRIKVDYFTSRRIDLKCSAIAPEAALKITNGTYELNHVIAPTSFIIFKCRERQITYQPLWYECIGVLKSSISNISNHKSIYELTHCLNHIISFERRGMIVYFTSKNMAIRAMQDIPLLIAKHPSLSCIVSKEANDIHKQFIRRMKVYFEAYSNI